MKDVAKVAGVSTATVSRVLNNTSYTSNEVKEKVFKAVKTLGYRPNRVARSLRVQKSTIIGLIVADIQNPFFTAVARAVEDTAYANGFNLLLCNTDEKKSKEKEYIDLMIDENVAGIIIAPTHQTTNSFKTIIKKNIPAIAIDRNLVNGKLDAVVIDNTIAAYKLLKHIFDTGKKKPLFIVGSSSTTGMERYKGFQKALKKYGQNNSKNQTYFVEAKEEVGYATMDNILKNKMDFDSVVTTNGLLAVGVFRRLKEANIKIPKEVGFATFDETLWTPIVEPAITVVRQPTFEMGQTAVELLLNKINTKEKTKKNTIVLKSKLITRASTIESL